jgi:DNA-binding response OmpR family regulator
MRQAFLHGEDMRLSPKEFALLHLFVTNEEKVLSTQYLYEKVWGQSMGEDSGALKTAMSRLRLKLGESDFMIVTQRGAGYSFYRE